MTIKYKLTPVLEIQTAESGMVRISREPAYHEYADDIRECLTIAEIEGLGGHYWSFSHIYSMSSCLNLLEIPPINYHKSRSFISWWLNFKIHFIDESIKPLLKRKLELYHLTGEIKNSFRNVNCGLEFNADCLLEWHNILQVDINKELIDLITSNDFVYVNEISSVTIYFIGFRSLPYSSILLKIDKSISLQGLLDYIYAFINKEVPAFSYSDKWILYNSTREIIFNKEKSSDCRTLDDLGIKPNDKIICYKK
jgi:hypothetical protein